MIVYINNDNKGNYPGLLDKLYKKRYKIFKEKYNWDIPTFNGYEKDEFDNRHASYLLYLDKDNEIIGGIRYNPTNYPYMVQSHFREHCFPHLPYKLRIANLPQDPSTVEVSRFFCCPHGKGSKSGAFSYETMELITASIELGLREGTDTYIAIIDKSMKRMYQSVGIECMEIGWAPAPDNGIYYIVLLPIEKGTYFSLLDLLGLKGPLIQGGTPIPVNTSQILSKK